MCIVDRVKYRWGNRGKKATEGEGRKMLSMWQRMRRDKQRGRGWSENNGMEGK